MRSLTLITILIHVVIFIGHMCISSYEKTLVPPPLIRKNSKGHHNMSSHVLIFFKIKVTLCLFSGETDSLVRKKKKCVFIIFL